MTEGEQIEHFANDLDTLINRYRSEYNICTASVVGCLEMKSFLLCREAEERHDPADGNDG